MLLTLNHIWSLSWPLFTFNLESMEGSEFVFNYVHLLYYKCHKINLNCGGSYVDSPYCIKNKKATINPIIKKDKCFQYAITVPLNEEIGKHVERIIKINPFFSKYNGKEQIYSERDGCKSIEKNNVTIVFNVLYAKKEKI